MLELRGSIVVAKRQHFYQGEFKRCELVDRNFGTSRYIIKVSVLKAIVKC